MPPKKTKPNEKCPCGSGKKHKKCCMIAEQLATSAAASSSPMDAPSLAAIVNAATAHSARGIRNEVMDALSPSASDIHSCSHGSMSDHFHDGVAYRDVIRDYLSMPRTDQSGRAEFVKGRLGYFGDLNFAHYIFAVCTSLYLQTKIRNRDIIEDTKELLSVAVEIKYFYNALFAQSDDEPELDLGQHHRYQHAIWYNGERGVINCLSRETKPFCDCMKDKKKEAKGMDRMELCDGCNILFPREIMKECSGCNMYPMFCSIGCYKESWPAHRERCQEEQHEKQKTKTALCELTQEEEL